MLKQYLEVGKIVGTHGIKGEVRVEPWCDSPAFLSKFKTLYLKRLYFFKNKRGGGVLNTKGF